MAKRKLFRVDVRGDSFKELNVISKKIGSVNQERLNKIFLVTAIEIAGHAQEEIQHGPKRTGRKYKKKSGRIHIASARGEFPASDTGQLVNSIKYESLPNGAVAGSVVKHGGYLETGTSKMAKRPWLEPSVQEKLPMMEERVDRLFEEIL